MGKVIIIEGIDGSGKATQSKLLKYCLMKENFSFYEKEPSYFVRQYLSGVYGRNAKEVSAKR